MKTLITLFFSLFLFSASGQDDPNLAAGNWGGALALPGGQSLKIVFHVVNNKGELSATMDSPDQGAYGLKMDEVNFKEGKIEMTMNQIQGTYKGTLKDGKFEGTWSQSGQTFTLNLERIITTGKS